MRGSFLIWGLLGWFASLTGSRGVEAAAPLPSATNLWVAQFPGYQNSCSSTPAVGTDGTIYVGTFHGAFLAYSPEGLLKWAFKAGREIKSSPAIAEDGTVYFGSRDRNFYALTPGGALKWKFATGAWVDSSPALASDGTVYFGGWDGFFYALNPDGSLRWKLGIGAIIDSSPAIGTDGTVYFGAHNKKCYALNPDGSVRWTFATGGVIVSSPAIGADGTVYINSTDGNLYGLSPEGSERWQSHTGNTAEASPVVGAGGQISIGCALGATSVTVTGFFDPDGQRRWTCPSACPIEVSGAAVADRFYVSIPWRTIQAVAPGVPPDERRIWAADMTDNATTSVTVSPEGILYVCGGYRLYAIRPPGELVPPANTPWPMFRAEACHTGRARISP